MTLPSGKQEVPVKDHRTDVSSKWANDSLDVDQSQQATAVPPEEQLMEEDEWPTLPYPNPIQPDLTELTRRLDNMDQNIGNNQTPLDSGN
jgi:hypothetical protein